MEEKIEDLKFLDFVNVVLSHRRPPKGKLLKKDLWPKKVNQEFTTQYA